MSPATDCVCNFRAHQPLKAGMTVLQNVTGENPLCIIIKIKVDGDFVAFALRGCIHMPHGS